MDLPDVRVAAVDTENSGLFADDGARLACVAVAWMEGGEVRSLALPFDQGFRDKLPAAQLELAEEEDPNLSHTQWDLFLAWAKQRKLVFHNAKYDLAMLRTGTRHWEGFDLEEAFYWDTMLAAGFLEPREPRGLDKAAQRAGLEGKSGMEEIKRWLVANKKMKGGMTLEAWKRRLDLAPWSVVEPYVTTDAEQTIALYEHQRRQLSNGRAPAMRREFDLCRVLYRMEKRGVPFHAKACLVAAAELERRVGQLEGLLPFEPSINKAKAYFFGEAGLKADRHTEKGNPCLDQEQVRKWASEGVEWAREYEAHAQASRALSMWYRGYPEAMGQDGRLRTSFKQGHVKSGRMSVERVQLQAMPKADKIAEGIPEVRAFVKAPAGKALWNLDLAQAELRVATKYARCARMAKMLEDGIDVHGDTTINVLGVEEGAPDWKLKRDIGKRLTFSAIFQIGAEHFQEILSKMTGIVMPIEECSRYVQTWRRRYPEYGQMYYRALNKAKRDGWVPILPGSEFETRHWFTQYDDLAAAWNRTVQGSLAEAFKMWMIEVEKEWPGALILTVHDSLLLELPARGAKKVAHEAAALGAEMMTRLFQTEMEVDAEPWVERYRSTKTEQYEWA